MVIEILLRLAWLMCFDQNPELKESSLVFHDDAKAKWYDYFLFQYESTQVQSFGFLRYFILSILRFSLAWMNINLSMKFPFAPMCNLFWFSIFFLTFLLSVLFPHHHHWKWNIEMANRTELKKTILKFRFEKKQQQQNANEMKSKKTKIFDLKSWWWW